MRASWLLLLSSCVCVAQTPPALARGVVVECRPVNGSGDLALRTSDDQIFRYRFDRKTYAERDDRLIEAARLQPGEPVEVVSDDVPGIPLRYARTIHVIPPASPRQAAKGRSRAYRLAEERATPAGNLTFSGVVFQLDDAALVMHTRESGDQRIRLRKDTRFLENGEIAAHLALHVNMRVFVRAGRDAYGDLEAYQVVWGTILEPR